jgi:peptidyl-prolyl cis-trans isomerase SurA
MNSTCLKLILSLTLSAATAAIAAPQALDRIVAVVDNSVITEHELQSRLAQTLQQLARQNTPPPPRRVLEKQLLERMITERILIQMAEDTNIRFEGPQLDRVLAGIAQKNRMSLEQFRKTLEKEGIDFAAFREQIRGEMMIGRLRERDVDNRVVVTDAEIDNYLANPSLDADRKTEYQLAHILLLAPEGASPEQLEELRGKAERALASRRPTRTRRMPCRAACSAGAARPSCRRCSPPPCATSRPARPRRS